MEEATKVLIKSKSKGDLTSRRASNNSKLSQKTTETKPPLKKQKSQTILTSRPIPLRKPHQMEKISDDPINTAKPLSKDRKVGQDISKRLMRNE